MTNQARSNLNAPARGDARCNHLGESMQPVVQVNEFAALFMQLEQNHRVRHRLSDRRLTNKNIIKKKHHTLHSSPL
jgi:hypothetical protein